MTASVNFSSSQSAASRPSGIRRWLLISGASVVLVGVFVGLYWRPICIFLGIDPPRLDTTDARLVELRFDDQVVENRTIHVAANSEMTVTCELESDFSRWLPVDGTPPADDDEDPIQPKRRQLRIQILCLAPNWNWSKWSVVSMNQARLGSMIDTNLARFSFVQAAVPKPGTYILHVYSEFSTNRLGDGNIRSRLIGHFELHAK